MITSVIWVMSSWRGMNMRGRLLILLTGITTFRYRDLVGKKACRRGRGVKVGMKQLTTYIQANSDTCCTAPSRAAEGFGPSFRSCRSDPSKAGVFLHAACFIFILCACSYFGSICKQRPWQSQLTDRCPLALSLEVANVIC